MLKARIVYDMAAAAIWNYYVLVHLVVMEAMPAVIKQESYMPVVGRGSTLRKWDEFIRFSTLDQYSL